MKLVNYVLYHEYSNRPLGMVSKFYLFVQRHVLRLTHRQYSDVDIKPRGLLLFSMLGIYCYIKCDNHPEPKHTVVTETDMEIVCGIIKMSRNIYCGTWK